MTYQIIETHCHLDYLKKQSLAETLTLAEQAGISKIITISVEPDNMDTVKELSDQHEMIYFSQGIHPHDAKLANADSMEKIKSRCGEKKMVAVGEIGLDYYYDHSPRDKQLEVFKEQFQIAVDNDKPVIIHSREADEDMIQVLNEYGPKLKRKGVVHSFTSGPELAQTAIDLGFYLGFNGIITFKNAEAVRDIVRLTPLDQILLETDAPFLTPVPHRGKENMPAYLPFILEKVAEIKSVTPAEVEATCLKSSKALFNL